MRSYQEELKYLDKVSDHCWHIKKGFVDNMKVRLFTNPSINPNPQLNLDVCPLYSCEELFLLEVAKVSNLDVDYRSIHFSRNEDIQYEY